MSTDYYVILGVTPDASQSQIQRAYRRLCKKLHPDARPEGDQGKFIEATEAYDALNDPERRAAYNRWLGRPTFRDRRAAMEPVDLFRAFQTYRPSSEEIHSVYLRNFTGAGPKSQSPRELNLEAVISLAEAARGTHIPLRIPVYAPCETCGGTGRAGFYTCDDCEGEGLHLSHRAVDVLIPRGTADGTVVEVSLSALGVKNLYLRLHVRVGGIA